MARFTLDLPDDASQVLANLCVAEQETQKTIIGRALGLYAKVRQEQGDSDNCLAITTKQGKIIKQVTLTW